MRLFLLRAALTLGILWALYRLTGCSPHEPVEVEPWSAIMAREMPLAPARAARCSTWIYDYGHDGRPIWAITFLDSVHPTLPAGATSVGIDWPHFREAGRLISSSKQTGPVRAYLPQAARAISEPTIALVRNPLTGITLPRERKHCWMSDAGVLLTIAPQDSVGPWRPFIEGRNVVTGKPGRTRGAAAPIAGEWTPLASGVITIPSEPDTIPAAIVARAKAGDWDEEYRNPGWISVGHGGMGATWPVDSLDGMYREPEGWVRKVRIFDGERQWFLRVSGRDSSVIRQPWIPGWSPSYEER